MREAVALSAAPLVSNLVAFHPWRDQIAVLSEARSLGLSVTGYFAMANGRTPGDPVLPSPTVGSFLSLRQPDVPLVGRGKRRLRGKKGTIITSLCRSFSNSFIG
ncbi:hypothetical protein [Novosphingobium guangzhouense]|uniref:hypothetical protein n=1 Tax=Novosphingobium guangzhouense TaxID=1850347 RepID=UPI0011AEC90B|nr:hypothetical protein [Novosphingobium guangzhouense]